MTYTPTNWTNVTTMADFLGLANNSSGGWFWTGILYMISIVLVITLIPFGIESAILAGLFGTIVVGILLVYMDLVSIMQVGVFVGLEFIIFLYLSYSNKYD